MRRIVADQADPLLEVTGEPLADPGRLGDDDPLVLPEHDLLSLRRRGTDRFEFDGIRTNLEPD